MICRFFIAVVLAVTAVVLSTRDCVAQANVRPNIIVVLIDDMGWGDLSCYGNARAATPHIDRLAAEGLRFEQFYVNAPICSPSRTAISTGQYPQRWRIGSYLADRRLNDQRGIAQWLDPQAPMLVRTLRDAGYATGHFGKWHMGGQRDVGEAPLIGEYGFDASLTNFEGLGPRVLPLCDAFDGRAPKRHALGSDKLGRGEIEWVDRSQVTGRYVGSAVEFMKASAAAGKPFYVNVWPDDVHSPFFPPAAKRGNGKKRVLYHGVLEEMDEQLATLLDFVRESEQLRENTIIVVLSDNGPEPGAGSPAPFRGRKGQLYEGGVRAPLIVWAPGRMNAESVGGVNAESVLAAFDLPVTLLGLAGAAAPMNVRFDGEALPDVLLGRSQASRSAPLFFRRPPDRGAAANGQDLPDLAVREGRWKLLCEYDGSAPQLYDMATDRGERTNLAEGHAELVKRLTAAVVAWHQSLPADKGATFRAPGG
jgi:arylsulfatase A-like enzyme